jgi:hypothetical protein
MTHLKMLGSWVCLPDGSEGHIAGATLDGLTIVVDGRMVIAAAKDVTPIAPPAAAAHPEPQRTVQAPIKTHHTADDMPAQRIVDPFNYVRDGGRPLAIASNPRRSWDNQGQPFPLGPVSSAVARVVAGAAADTEAPLAGAPDDDAVKFTFNWEHVHDTTERT